MSAGQPNWQKLHEMGKLPKSQIDKVAGLQEIFDLNKEIKRLHDGMCEECRTVLFSAKIEEEAPFNVPCPVEGCEFVGKGKTEPAANNSLRLHSKKHDVK